MLDTIIYLLHLMYIGFVVVLVSWCIRFAIGWTTGIRLGWALSLVLGNCTLLWLGF